VYPGTNRPWASWGAGRFASAAGLLAARGRIALVADGRAVDAAATGMVTAAARAAGARTLDLAGRTDLAEAAAVMRAASVVLANDSGAAHLAVAVGTPVVAIFGPTDPRLFWGWDAPDRNVALAGPSSCPRPCFRSWCPGDHGYDHVTPKDVARIVERLIELPAARRSA
jgi:ADP-heptose:LPS heptosyltransferase